MPLAFTYRLQALFSEIRNRFFYLLLSFFFTFVISYWYSKPLLYLFALPFVNKYLKTEFFGGRTQNELHNDSLLEKSEMVSAHVPLAQPSVSSEATPFWEDEGFAFGTTFLGVPCKSSNLSFFAEEGIRKGFFSRDVFDSPGMLFFGKEQFSYSFVPLFSGSTLENLVNFCKEFKDVASRSFIFTDVEEAFSCQILVCFILSFVMIFPILFYESFSFFAPSFYKAERRKWIWRIITIAVSWYFFIYNVQNYCLPKLADFLLKFEISSLAFSVTAETKIKSYCIWAITVFIIGNLIFFFTICVLFLIYEQKIKIEYFTVQRKKSRIFILLFSAFLAPPEIQFFLALIGILCFEVMVYFFFIYKQFQIFGRGCIPLHDTRAS